VATKHLKELKNMSASELSAKIQQSEAELFQTKMKHVTGQLSDTASLWRLRKNIARMKTLLGQASQGSK